MLTFIKGFSNNILGLLPLFTVQGFVRAGLQSNFNEIRQKVAAELEQLKLIESLHNTPAQKTLIKLYKEMIAFLTELSSDATLNPIAEIIAKKIQQHKDPEWVNKKLIASPSLSELGKSLATIIKIRNYRLLAEQLKDYQKFATLDKPRQLELCQENPVLDAIMEEHHALDVSKITSDCLMTVDTLCVELALSDPEKKTVKSLFQQIFTQHLPRFNAKRKKLMIEIPVVFEAQQAKMVRTNPGLAAELRSQPALIIVKDKKEEKKRKVTRAAQDEQILVGILSNLKITP